MHIDRDDRLRGPFEASLPIAGIDGTLAARMKGTAAEGNARAKSGTLANVRSLAGYVTSADGEPLVFAIVANNFGTMPEVAIAAIDAIVVKLARIQAVGPAAPSAGATGRRRRLRRIPWPAARSCRTGRRAVRLAADRSNCASVRSRGRARDRAG